MTRRLAAAAVSAGDRAVVRDLTAQLDGITASGEFPLARLLPVLRELLGLDGAAAYRMFHEREWSFEVLVDDGLQPGWKDRFVRGINALDRPVLRYDPGRAEPRQANRVRIDTWTSVVDDPEMASHVPIARSIGTDRRDQIRSILCDGDVVLAWVGGFRAEPYTRRERALFEALVPAFQRALVMDRKLRDARLAVVGLAAALDVIPAAAVVARWSGQIAHANASARVLLARRSRAMDAEIASAVASGGNASWSCTRLVAEGVPSHFLLVRRAPTRDLEQRLARAGLAWGLTPRQVDVLRYLVRGDANKTIAERLGCAVITVEVHVTALLRKSRCDARAQLVGRFWTLA